MYGKEKMKKDFNEEKAKIIVTVIPFVLIIIVLFITLIVSSVKDKGSENDHQDLQEAIRENGDANLPESEKAGSADATVKPSASTDAVQDKEESGKESGISESAFATPTPYREIMQKGKVDYDKVDFDKDEQLKEMMTYWADNNQKALDDLAALDRFRAMSWKLKGTKDFYYYGETDGNGQPNGTGIAVYADNQYYYGEWENGMRSGQGTWMHYHVHETESKTDLYTYHQYTGSFKNDLPDGEGSEHYEYNGTLFEDYVGYDTNLVGSYSAGLLNGDFYLTKVYSDHNVKEWEGSASHGSWNYLDTSPDPKAITRPIQYDLEDPESYIWIKPSENKNFGVPCLISKNKN